METIKNADKADGGRSPSNIPDSKKKNNPLQHLSLVDFFDTNKPWVLVKDGSLGGYFEWVPRRLRVGPWSNAATFCFTGYFCATLLVGVNLAYAEDVPDWNVSYADVSYPEVLSVKWCYQITIGLWMVYVMSLIVRGPAGPAAWSTYTVQSWTLLTTRHFLCALAPAYAWAFEWCEKTRFPAACSMTITFFVWNFVLFPYCYCIAMKTPEKKRNFLQFATSFRLTQIHVFNFIFGVCNLCWASPKRKLVVQDFYLAIISTMAYMMWYLGVLDRIGVHLYPVFSPRASTATVFGVWNGLLGLYAISFFVWRHLMGVS